MRTKSVDEFEKKLSPSHNRSRGYFFNSGTGVLKEMATKYVLFWSTNATNTNKI